MNQQTILNAFAYSILAGLVYYAANDIDWENRPVNAGDRLVETVEALRSGLKESSIGEAMPIEQSDPLLLYSSMG